jgi:DtxR family transcriptional regulator, Mn-dependent transcriptional regulator
MIHEHNSISSTMRDYLAQIYRLADRGEPQDGYISTSALAELLDVSAPAVNRMVTKLKESALLEHEPYQGIKLTANGTVEALKALRLHRIAEAFLVKVMGFGWHQVHAEAEQMAQGLSAILAERMWTMAGEPTHCPHGEPIPSAEGTIRIPQDQLLIDADITIALTISRVRTREADRLEYLAALGLLPGTHLQIIHKAPFNGPLQLKIGSEYRIVGHNLAELLRVDSAEMG